MILKTRWIGAVILMSCISFAHSLDLTKMDISFQYDLSIKDYFEYRIVDAGENFLKIVYRIDHDTTAQWRLSLLAQNGYASAVHDTLAFDSQDTLFIDEKSVYCSLEFPKSRYDLIVFTQYNLVEGYYRIYDVFLNAPGYPKFYPVDKRGAPLLVNYTTEDQLSFVGRNSTFHVFQYKEMFGPADPPMGEMAALAPTLSIDSSYFVDREIPYLQDYRFYLIQGDTLDDSGITILKCPYYFPEQRTLDELIKPMRYISTTSENESLNQTSDPRKAFENFWLTNYGTKFRAKSAIRFFFQRVEEANTLFTDYKQGWKTDRGILYVIYGKPDIVIRRDRVEEWRYDTGEKFEFIRIPILFTPSLYSLRRSKDYERGWYNQVGSIRKGQ